MMTMMRLLRRRVDAASVVMLRRRVELVAARALSHRAVKVQDLLLSHPAIARVSTWSPSDEQEAVHAIIMPRPGALYTPWHGMHGNPHDDKADGTLIDYVQQLLQQGVLDRAGFVHKPEKLPASRHDRVTLNELLQAVHEKADANGDGAVTRDCLSLLFIYETFSKSLLRCRAEGADRRRRGAVDAPCANTVVTTDV